jgi:hypothetical protein
MDSGDSVEGFMAEKAGVIRHTSSSSSIKGGGSKDSGEPDLLSGLPYRVSSSMSASKDQTLVQVRRHDWTCTLQLSPVSFVGTFQQGQKD